MPGNEPAPRGKQNPDIVSVEEIPVIRIELQWEKPIPGNNHTSELRGALAAQFPDNPLFHQHQDDKFVYRYPLIQYRWRNGKGILIGFHEGAKELLTLPWFGLQLRLGEIEARIMDLDFSCKLERFAFAEGLRRYDFLSPWLPLNQANYEKYIKMSPKEQAQERDRLLVTNLIAAAKGLSVFLDGQVLASFVMRRALICRYKDQQLQGFFGTVVTNLALPQDIAIGSKVSHGFGWLVSEKEGAPINKK